MRGGAELPEAQAFERTPGRIHLRTIIIFESGVHFHLQVKHAQAKHCMLYLEAGGPGVGWAGGEGVSLETKKRGRTRVSKPIFRPACPLKNICNIWV